MVVLSPLFRQYFILSSWFLSDVSVPFHGRWSMVCLSSCSASGNVTVRWRRRRYRSSSGFLHHHLLGCYGLLAQLRVSFSNWLNDGPDWRSLTVLQQQRQWPTALHTTEEAKLHHRLMVWFQSRNRSSSFERHHEHHKRLPTTCR